MPRYAPNKKALRKAMDEMALDAKLDCFEIDPDFVISSGRCAVTNANRSGSGKRFSMRVIGEDVFIYRTR